MRVSSTAFQTQNRRTAAAKTGGSTFSTLLNASVSQRNAAAIGSPANQAGHVQSLANPDGIKIIEWYMKPTKLSDFERPVRLDTSNIPAEKLAELNEKYQIDNIMPGSPEYHALVKDLQEAGLLSELEIYMLPPNTVSIGTDSEGYITSILTYWGNSKPDDAKSWNLLDYLENMLSFISNQYRDLSAKTLLTDEERVLLSVYQSYSDILSSLRTIFAGQNVQ